MHNSNNESIVFLWHSFLNGDDKSFAIIYQQHIDKLLSYGYKLVNDRELVIDCIQNLFVDLFLNRTKLSSSIKNPKAYLFVALRNNLIKKVTKKRKREFVRIGEDQQDTIFNAEYSYQDQLIELEVSNEIRSKLNIAVHSLSARQKEIVYLKFEGELNYKEISAIMGISVESARKLLHRAILSLREIVKPIN